MKSKTTLLLTRLSLLILLGITQPSIVSGQASLNDCDTVKHICYSDYVLLIEYAQLGINHDSIVIELRRVIENLETQNELTEDQIKLLKKESDLLQNHVREQDKELAVRQRKIKFLRFFATASTTLSGVLLLVLSTS